MKLAEGKHDHKLTKLLKVCLFGLIMILPFLAILPSTLYFAFNEHAQNYTHEEVITTYEYETNEVNSVDDLVVGNIYKVQIDLDDYYYSSNLLYTNGIFHLYATEYDVINIHANEGYSFRLLYDYNLSNIRLYLTTGTYVIFTPSSNIVEFYCLYYDNTNINNLTYSASDYLGEKSVEVVSSEQSPLNAFNTASNNVWNSPIFNWVNDGLGSIAIANMLTVFGIARNTFISNILIYWLSITAIYIIIDIVITAFTILTHLITKKAE